MVRLGPDPSRAFVYGWLCNVGRLWCSPVLFRCRCCVRGAELSSSPGHPLAQSRQVIRCGVGIVSRWVVAGYPLPHHSPFPPHLHFAGARRVGGEPGSAASQYAPNPEPRASHLRSAVASWCVCWPCIVRCMRVGLTATTSTVGNNFNFVGCVQYRDR